MVREIRERLLAIGGAAPGGDYECVLMQGSGTFAIESVISSAIPRGGRLLVLVNGAYGRRIAQMARVHGIDSGDDGGGGEPQDRARAVAERLAAAPGYTHVAVVHCETTTGILNPDRGNRRGGGARRSGVHRGCHEQLRRDSDRSRGGSRGFPDFVGQ